MNSIDSVCIYLYCIYIIFLIVAGIVANEYDKKNPGYLSRVNDDQCMNKFESRFILAVGFATIGIWLVSGMHILYIIFRVISHFLQTLL